MRPYVIITTVLLLLLIAVFCSYDPQGVGLIDEGKLYAWWFPWYYFAMVPQEDFAEAHRLSKRAWPHPQFHRFDPHVEVVMTMSEREFRFMNYAYYGNLEEFDN